MSLKVGIICAGDREAAPFLNHIQNVKTSENAQHPKGSVGSHMFRILGKIKLNFRCKKIELLMKSKEGEDW